MFGGKMTYVETAWFAIYVVFEHEVGHVGPTRPTPQVGHFYINYNSVGITNE